MRFPSVPVLLAAFVLAAAVPAGAAPAPWYVWRSTLDGAEHCAQTSPGPAWERVRGPFRDVHCSRPLRTSPAAMPRN
ncbi:hypothetical protein E6C76_00710 [Pseudothauera nasutitermitis]|uniref:Secreted protein n=1 Tax=Pseudothauera nasutitermitis TaxID=2565930 RepID=A0A4S4B304_9RHOO|nr:hypothetical protein [Pseudothauera nasutitermitis]THF66949.1 hypothetical protein E6C76_00710 [Pseudothauera nasutitermitis]